MNFNVSFFVNALLLGVGLAMDSFSVSIANGLADPSMKKSRGTFMAATYGTFQAAMPLIGWFCVHTIAETFEAFQPFIPWIALILLLYIGGGMFKEGIEDRKKPQEEIEKQPVTTRMVLLQGIATAIDALSVGFTIAEYNFVMALVCVLIIGVTTFIISQFGVTIGKKFGTKLNSSAQIFGGIILIGIGLEIFITSFF